uniref:Putative LAGLIDADG homing endonuclease n=1 Tax=Lobochlamys segnis TaxID=52035 RepID=Q8WKZ8_9CHLO|nr:unknown [Lobochlamys segnis]ALO21040.1 putative LAGLIDADG homing endonuclease [Lobochlamys segnis]
MSLQKPIVLKPGEKLSDDFLEEIREMNAGKPDFPTYKNRVRTLFGLAPVIITEEKKLFLGGFTEGEGSISVSAKKNPNASFGVEIDPLFNITQHINGVAHLYDALEIFGTGRIRFKSSSNATLVFSIETRLSLVQKVCPFFEKYIIPYASPVKKKRFKNFEKVLSLFDEGAHLDRDRFINEILPLWDDMRMQFFEKQTFKTLEEAQDFARNYSR